MLSSTPRFEGTTEGEGERGKKRKKLFDTCEANFPKQLNAWRKKKRRRGKEEKKERKRDTIVLRNCFFTVWRIRGGWRG